MISSFAIFTPPYTYLCIIELLNDFILNIPKHSTVPLETFSLQRICQIILGQKHDYVNTKRNKKTIKAML
jgi:hypothetical protein